MMERPSRGTRASRQHKMKVKERDGAGQVHEQQNLKASTLRNSPAFKVYRFLACVSASASYFIFPFKKVHLSQNCITHD